LETMRTSAGEGSEMHWSPWLRKCGITVCKLAGIKFIKYEIGWWKTKLIYLACTLSLCCYTCSGDMIILASTKRVLGEKF
jgi:hypothetical protein